MIPTSAAPTAPHPLLDVSVLLRERVLRHGTSLGRAGDRLWRAPHLEALLARLEAAIDGAGGSVHDRWATALDGATPPLVRLAGEALALHLVIASDITAATKQRLLDATYGHLDDAPPLPPAVAAALGHGRTPTGVAFKRRRLSQIAFLLRAARGWRDRSGRERRGLLDDPWAFRTWLRTIPVAGAHAQREALLHLAHPDTFEPITSRAAKERIVAALSRSAEADLDVDEALLRIRERWTGRLDAGFSFGDPPLRDRWLG